MRMIGQNEQSLFPVFFCSYRCNHGERYTQATLRYILKTGLHVGLSQLRQLRFRRLLSAKKILLQRTGQPLLFLFTLTRSRYRFFLYRLQVIFLICIHNNRILLRTSCHEKHRLPTGNDYGIFPAPF